MQILHMLHSLHQYHYLPLILFIVAALIFIASFFNRKSQARYLGYVVAVVLVASCVFVI